MTTTPDLVALFDLMHGAEPIVPPAPPRPDGRYRSPITQPGYGKGKKPGNWQKTYPKEPPTPEEVLRLLAVCPTGKIGTRNKALIAVLWRSGLRIHEGLLLRPHHVSAENHEITVLRGKGGRARVVGIDDGGLRVLDEWLPVRDRLELPAEAPLFCTVSEPNPGRPIYAAYVRKVLHQYAAAAGIPKRIHPHSLRHALAVELVREGAPMPYIQRQLGHSSLATTATYLQGLGAGEHIEFVAAREWPGATA